LFNRRVRQEFNQFGLCKGRSLLTIKSGSARALAYPRAVVMGIMFTAAATGVVYYETHAR